MKTRGMEYESVRDVREMCGLTMLKGLKKGRYAYGPEVEVREKAMHTNEPTITKTI